jgi:hypothetical protein
MNQTEFVYWLQGMLEYTNVMGLDGADAKAKLQGIKDHLKLVFTKQTPEPKKEVPKVKDPNVIEPSEALKKLFEGAAKQYEQGRKPGGIWPSPTYIPEYFLDRMPNDWGIPRQYKFEGPIC